jgi:hypothetical protein
VSRNSPNRSPFSRRFILLIIAVLVVMLLWIGYWAVASHVVREAVEGEVARAASRGIMVDCDTLEWGGFPFRFERDCAGVRVEAHGSTATAARALAILQAWNYNHVVTLVDGPVTLDIPSVPFHATLTHERALASFRRLGEGWQASLELPKLKADRFGSADRLLVSARRTEPGITDLALEGTRVGLTVPMFRDLTLDRAALDARIPSAALARDFARVLAQSGDTIAIQALGLKKGNLTVSATGTIGIDADGKPSGTLVTSCNRIDLMLALLETEFGLKESEVQSLGAMIGLLSGGKPDGPAKLNLIAKDGKLYWGPVRLADLPSLF